MAELTRDWHVPYSGPDRSALHRSDATWIAAVLDRDQANDALSQKALHQKNTSVGFVRRWCVDLCPRFLTHIPSQESLIRTGAETTGIQLTQIWFACAVADVQLKRLCCEAFRSSPTLSALRLYTASNESASEFRCQRCVAHGRAMLRG